MVFWCQMNYIITSSESLREIVPVDLNGLNGLNINWCRLLFCLLSKIAPKFLKLGRNSKPLDE